MTHALVRWANMGRARVCDVVSIRDIVETKIVAAILQNPKDPSIVQADVRVRWEGEKHPAKIIAIEITAATGELRRFHEELRNRPACRSDNQEESQEEEEDTGGFIVKKQLLRMVDLGPKKSPTCYARELLRQLFEPGELAGTSLTARQSNAHKDKDAKPQLDAIRVNAVIKHYPCTHWTPKSKTKKRNKNCLKTVFDHCKDKGMDLCDTFFDFCLSD